MTAIMLGKQQWVLHHVFWTSSADLSNSQPVWLWSVMECDAVSIPRPSLWYWVLCQFPIKISVTPRQDWETGTPQIVIGVAKVWGNRSQQVWVWNVVCEIEGIKGSVRGVYLIRRGGFGVQYSFGFCERVQGDSLSCVGLKYRFSFKEQGDGVQGMEMRDLPLRCLRLSTIT